MNNEEKNKDLILKSFNANLKIHIVIDGKGWRNGFVKETENEFFTFVDCKNIIPEAFFYSELISVEPYLKEEGKE